MKLLDYLREPDEVTLLPWPLVKLSDVPLSRSEAMSSPQVMVVNAAMGPPFILRPGEMTMTEKSKSGLFNRLNWERLKPGQSEGLVDSNASPVLLWTPATHSPNALIAGNIGSQADSMRSISEDYKRWVERVMNWVRRTGTTVWGLGAGSIRPDLDIRRTDVTTVFALPDALAQLEDGVAAH